MTHTQEPACIAPFMSLAIWATGHSVICCEDKGYPSEKSVNDVENISELVNCERIRQVRRQFLTGEVPDGCRACLRESRFQPLVHGMYKRWSWDDVKQHYHPDTGEVDETRYLLVALSSVCTYSCRMCFDDLSTRLDTDRSRIFGRPYEAHRPNDIKKIVKFIQSNPIQAITFHGGNPLNEPRLVEALSAVDSAAEVEIISNGSTLTPNGEDVLPHLARFREVRFNVSLDGTRDTTEYIRIHSNFDAVVRHIERIRSLPGVQVNIHNTITNLNVFDLPSHYSMLLWGELAGVDSVSSYIATAPDIYCVYNLPEPLRHKARIRLEQFIYKLRSAGLDPADHKAAVIDQYTNNVLRRIDSVDFDPDLFRRFLSTTKTLDDYYRREHMREFATYLRDPSSLEDLKATDSGLRELQECWVRIPRPIRDAIMELVRTVAGDGPASGN